LKNLQINYGSTASHRQQILGFVIGEKASNPGYRVVDIGGIADNWSSTCVDMLVDINAEDTSSSMKIDICDQDSWSKLLSYVDENGRFDFAICTHTLEDIYDPVVVIKHLPKIARSGVITMPSITTELSPVENKNWLGYIHHRWIFDQHDDKMLIIPKLGILETMCRGRNVFDPARSEVMYTWNEDIPYSMFMNNYLGPNASTVIYCYNELINGIKNNYD
jgi:hypothetical protein